ncbi:Structural maintenance of chromosomes protein 3 [Malassezia cuniculi]|uniref:Structural maintenance of chromosomes protein 3 n=1 Tax=Malassezia cuniculi TaxID=948313 RepID=A0AAF0ETF2_9BASI|nr:Structural maintenance of chromosomes protein 3 [Malassezia cuniculi]
MDVDMADARATRAARAPGNRRVSGSRRAAPYEKSQCGANLSIKGASGPTWVVVANLVRGTSPQDVRLTFEPFGKVTDVRRYNMDNLPNKAVAFEVGFENRSDAIAACRKYDGVLADGRTLQVVLASELSQGAAPQKQAQGAQSAPGVQSTLSPAVIPTATAAAAAVPANLPIDVRRKLAEAEARYLKEQEAIISGKRTTTPPKPKTEKLASRIGSLPLAQRLAAEVPTKAASDKAQRKRRPQKQRAAGMQVDN